ncbi:hypothetical protein GGR55DRAFT_575904 [Xylaria sp. FL0064]|nr:hypothetical protein GGR55DRAFT_575904 [Xylaria sp. FL0064]
MSNLDFSHLSTNDLLEALREPALSPPEGVNPNFEHPPNLNAVAVTGLLVCLILTSAFLFIRIYVKFFKIKQLCIGDYLMMLAYVRWQPRRLRYHYRYSPLANTHSQRQTFYLVVVVGSLVRVNSAVALFVHQWNVRGGNIEDYLLHIFIGIEFWLGAILLVKSSILLEWLRIFAPTGSRPFTLSCKVLLVVTILFYAAAIIVLNLTCRPFKKAWDKTVEGTCVDIKRIHLGVVIVNLLLDIATLVLPQPVIWSLQMTRLRRAGVSTIFTIGILAIIAAGFLIDAVVSWMKTDDMTYYYSAVALWGIAETTCATLVFCVPFAPRFFHDIHFFNWFANALPFKLSSDCHRTEWFQEPSGERQSCPRISKQHDYQEIDETTGIHLRGYGSPRPTDRQYGIAVTTDIVVTESYEQDYVKVEDHQHPWINTRRGVE